MKNHLWRARLTLVLLTVVTVLSLTVVSSATGNILKSDLTGIWNIVFHGNTGCGLVAMAANTALNTSGKGTASLVTHGQCGDSSLSGQTFTIQSLASDGYGTANLTCGTACGWNFNIQVSPDRSKFPSLTFPLRIPASMWRASPFGIRPTTIPPCPIWLATGRQLSTARPDAASQTCWSPSP